MAARDEPRPLHFKSYAGAAHAAGQGSSRRSPSKAPDQWKRAAETDWLAAYALASDSLNALSATSRWSTAGRLKCTLLASWPFAH